MAVAARPVPLKPTKGYEITMFEIKSFCAALGLDPREVISLHVEGKRVIATVAETGPPADPLHPTRQIVIPITEPRGPKR